MERTKLMDIAGYDLKVIKEIAKHMVEPNAVNVALQLMGKPLDKVLAWMDKADNKLVQKITDGIASTTEDVMIKVVQTANSLCSDTSVIAEYKKRGIVIKNITDVHHLDLSRIDPVADSYDLSNAAILGTEGALMGVATTLCEGIPFGQLLIVPVILADVSSSLVLLSRHICQISTSYGYTSQDYNNIPHILAAMMPVNTSSDEGYLVNKAIATNAMREAGQFIAKNQGNITKELIENQAPRLIQLINTLVERLGIEITEKELGILVPIAGAMLNGGLNVAFQQVGHTTAKDYFRELHLCAKYGDMAVNSAIKEEIKKINEQKVNKY